jgi:folate-binding protein YgfZ
MTGDAGALYRECRAGRGMADMRARVKLAVRGADRVRYLNGQVTSNVTHLVPGVAQSACVVSAKGKLQAEVWIARGDDTIFIDADGALRDTLQARLEKYVIADDVTIEDVSDAWQLVHLFGPPFEETISDAVRIVAARRFAVEGTDLWVPALMFDQVSRTLRQNRVCLDETILESIRIERGVPRWGYELDEQTLPPEAALDRTHIDYQKGCYIGQEVISRLKSVGHVNRRLVGFVAINPNHQLRAPMTVKADAASAPAGQITSAAWSFAMDRSIALGYLKRGVPTTGLIAHDNEHGAIDSGIGVTVQELPFVS